MINPQIRFKKPDGSAFADFHAVRLGDCLQSVSVKKKQLVAEIYSVSNSAGFVPQVEQFDGRDNIASEDTSGYKLVKRGEFAYNPSRINVGSLARLDNKELVAVSPLYVVFRIVQYLDSNYFLNWFGTSSFRRGMLKNIEGGVRDSLSYDGLSDIVIVCPSDVVEQQKVAQFLSEIDNLIQSAENELEATKQLKKAMLQKMFPKKGEKVPEVRFPGFTGDWEQRKLSDEFAEFIVPMRDKPKEFGGSIPWTRIEDIEGKYLNGTLSGQYVTEDTVKKMNLKIIPKDSLIVSSSATFGVVAVVTQDLITNQTFIGLVPNDKNTLDYWYSYFQSGEARRYMKLQSAGSTIFYISRESFENMPITLPSKEEAVTIGKLFTKLDETITLHQRELDAYKKFKKAMMQKMFV